MLLLPLSEFRAWGQPRFLLWLLPKICHTSNVVTLSGRGHGEAAFAAKAAVTRVFPGRGPGWSPSGELLAGGRTGQSPQQERERERASTAGVRAHTLLGKHRACSAAAPGLLSSPIQQEAIFSNPAPSCSWGPSPPLPLSGAASCLQASAIRRAQSSSHQSRGFQLCFALIQSRDRQSPCQNHGGGAGAGV